MPINSSALNTYDARNRNLAAVLEAIREGKGLSRTEIARTMPFSLQTMTNVTQELIAMGLVEETARPGTGRKGNPHTGLRVVPGKCCALGAQIRWNLCAMTLVDLDYGVIAENCVPITSFEPGPYLDEVIAALNTFLEAHATNDIWMAGISAPLPLRAPNVPPHDLLRRDKWIDQRWSAQFWETLDVETLHARFSQGLGLPVTIMNNPQSVALAEALHRPADARFIYLMLGLGLGAAFVSDRAINRDFWRHGGEIGHIVLDGQPLSAVLSASGIRIALGLDEPHGEFEALVAQAIKRGDPRLDDWLAQASRLLGFIVNFLENAVWPDGIVLGGFLPRALLDALVARTLPLSPSVAQAEVDPGRKMPRFAVARRSTEAIPFGAAATVLGTRSNPDFPDMLGRRRQTIK